MSVSSQLSEAAGLDATLIGAKSSRVVYACMPVFAVRLMHSFVAPCGVNHVEAHKGRTMHAHIVVAVKLVVAVGALTALTSIPAKLLWPALSLLQLAALLVAALVVLVVLSVCLL